MSEVEYDGRAQTLFLRGGITKDNVNRYLAHVEKRRPAPVTKIDVGGVEAIDNAGFGLLAYLKRALPPGGAELVNVPPEVAAREELLERRRDSVTEEEGTGAGRPPVSERAAAAVGRFGDYLVVAADIIGWSVIGLFLPRYHRRGDFAEQCYRIGALAVPVLILLSIVMGLIMALQSAVQLQQVGADLFVADLLAIAVIREMAPMITAILLAGRSGSAITSQIGTMKVTEEIDALRVIGIQPLRYIAVPMFLAGSVVMPFLVAVAMVVSALGGVIAGITILGINPVTFIDRLVGAIGRFDVVTTFIKSEVFMWGIVTIAAYYGMRVRGGSQEIGKATTSSVVASIFAVIFIDVLFSLLALR